MYSIPVQKEEESRCCDVVMTAILHDISVDSFAPTIVWPMKRMTSIYSVKFIIDVSLHENIFRQSWVTFYATSSTGFADCSHRTANEE
jgi:hypothetical protein